MVVYNNILARLRRTGTSLEEASMDLGATTFQTFRLVTFPQLRSALLAGALLAFALSFDEIVVTTFTTAPGLQTLPLWIFDNLFRPNQAPVSTWSPPSWSCCRCCRSGPYSGWPATRPAAASERSVLPEDHGRRGHCRR